MVTQATDHIEILEIAKEHFNENRYTASEPLLNQLILKGNKSADVFHMLGTIYYDQGKFNKAIRAFKRSLELDPHFTDASIGLSIILNDLGRYEEGKKIFEEAQLMLDRQKTQSDPYINEKLSIKHDELGELYYKYKRYKESLEQYFKALHLSTRKAELTLKVVECFMQLNETEKAIKELKTIIRDYPDFITARLRLGQIYYDLGQVPEAISEWESVLSRNPKHPEADRLLKQAQSVEVTKNNALESL